MIPAILQNAYDAFKNDPKFILTNKQIVKATKGINIEDLPAEIQEYISMCREYNKSDLEKRLEILTSYEKAKQKQERLIAEADDKNIELQDALDQLKDRESELEASAKVIQESKAKIEEQNKRLSSKLLEEQQYNLTLSKDEGLQKISLRILWIMGILSFAPVVLYALFQSDKILDIFENIVILAFGTFSGALLGYAGAKNSRGSSYPEAVSSAGGNDCPDCPDDNEQEYFEE